MENKAAAVSLLLLASLGHADEVVLKDGGKLVGKATRVGDEVVVATPHGETHVKAEAVELVVEGRTVWDDYADRLKATDAKDAAAEAALGSWCREKKLGIEATEHWKKAVALDPDQAEARNGLGFVRLDERWVTMDEYYRARGFVKVGDEWVPEEEARRDDAERKTREAFAKHEKTIRGFVTRMSSMKRKTRNDAKVALQKYAEEIGDLRLGAFASEVEEFYNAGWREIRTALVKLEVRATMATLKRPIPTIETSLGGSSTPVRIQLPELSIVSIKTTVLAPAEIELDEDP